MNKHFKYWAIMTVLKLLYIIAMKDRPEYFSLSAILTQIDERNHDEDLE